MTFSYNANLFSNCAHGRIAEFAQTLFGQLDMERVGAVSRPILFICHSMGGLVVKKASSSRSCPKHSSLSESGPNHRARQTVRTSHSISSNAAKWADIGVRLWKVARGGAPVTASAKELKQFAQSVMDIHEGFVDISDRFSIVSCFEQKGYGVISLVVDPESAKMGVTAEKYVLGINANHVDICRFARENDSEYLQMRRVINYLVRQLGIPITDDLMQQGVASRLPIHSLHVPGDTTLAATELGFRSSIDGRRSIIVSNPSEVRDIIVTGLPQGPQPGFSGRETILKKNHTHFTEHSNGTLAFGLGGYGGVDKTQVALKYVHSQINNFKAVFWVVADTEQKSTPEETTERVKSWLRNNPGWLFVLDNVEEPNLLKYYWPESFGRDGCIIVTSRHPGLGRPSSAVPVTDFSEVDCFDTEGGAKILWSQLSDPDEDEKHLAAKIVEKLGGLPLAINHMASYIDTQQISLSEFLATYERHERDFIQQTPPGANFAYEKTLATAWTLSMSALSKETSRLLGLLSLLDPDHIPLEIIQHFHEKDESICIAARDSSVQSRAIASLYNGSLIKKIRKRGTPGYLIMHCLVQSAVRRQWELEGKNANHNMLHRSKSYDVSRRTTTWKQYTTSYNVSEDAMVSREISFNSAIACISRLYPKQDKGQSMIKQFSECHKYSQHLLSIENFYKKNVDHVVGTKEFASTLAHCGWYFFEKGQTDSPKRVLLTAESICLKLHGSEFNQTLGLIYNNLGAVCTLRLEYREGLGYTKNAIKHREKAIPDDDPEIQQLGVSYMNYADDLQILKPFRQAEAENYYQKALEICRNRPGGTASTSELVLSNMSFSFYKWKRLPEALRYVTEAIELHAEYGDMTTFMLYTLYYRGEIQCAMGDIRDAYKTHKECLEHRRALQGDVHYTTGLSFYKAGYLAWRSGKNTEAIDLLQRSVAAFKEYRDDPRIWPRSCIKLGRILIEEGQIENGQEKVRDGLRVVEITGKASMYIKDEELDLLMREDYR
ncbi:hypothetical protein BS50DRAFT_662785 [Corynespora cassiicola Philippines]|uniref:DUF7779 domain-containing protein n=1 Tax=Corynespora cassiicola Philippines TaxID=1448308 RepID=A0A2T2NYM1_CORCC|nr:hypothetical protein BS50DRAFT_662785 [Corynespora cassiicola Philippines]